MMIGMGRGAAWAGKNAMKASRRGGRLAARYGSEMWDRIPRDEIRDTVADYRENVTDYLGRAKDAIDDAVESELKDLRRAVRRQRKRLGI